MVGPGTEAIAGEGSIVTAGVCVCVCVCGLVPQEAATNTEEAGAGGLDTHMHYIC